MKRFPEIIVTTTLLLLFAAGPAAAASVSVAVAANFLQPMEKLAALFTARTGIKVEYRLLIHRQTIRAGSKTAPLTISFWPPTRNGPNCLTRPA